jgi:hypothetical protein
MKNGAKSKLTVMAALVLAFVFLAVTPYKVIAAQPPQNLADKIGVAHANGNYYFSSEPYLVEGAKQIHDMGSRIIKVFLRPEHYRYNSNWPPNCPELVDVLKTSYFQALFGMDFNTFVLQAHWNTRDHNGWLDGLDDRERIEIEKNYYDAASYLISHYGETEKRFILEHWEAELYLELNTQKHLQNPTPQDLSIAYEGFLDYLAARHAGVEKARRNFPNSKAKVFSAVEVVHISSQSDFRLVDHMNRVKSDYVSYSMHECGTDIALYKKNTNILKKSIGKRPWYIGEIMVAEKQFANTDIHSKSMLSMINAVFQSGAEFLILWEIYDNEPAGSQSMKTDSGFGLIRRDGTATALYSELCEMLSEAGDGTETWSKNIVTSEYFKSLGIVTKWLEEENGVAYGAAISELKKDFIPPPGWVIHTERVPEGNIGDKIAYKGETMSLFIPSGMPGFNVK